MLGVRFFRLRSVRSNFKFEYESSLLSSFFNVICSILLFVLPDLGKGLSL